MDYVRTTTEKNEFTTLVRNLNKDIEFDLAKNLKKNPKDFWQYCKSKLKSKSLFPNKCMMAVIPQYQ